MTPEDHALDRVGLLHIIGIKHAVEPARHGDAFSLHQLLVGKAAEHVVIVHVPDPRPVLPGTGGDAVIAWQSVRQHTEVGSALNVVVAAEDIGATAGRAHIAERQLQDAVGPGIVITVGVLGAAHAPDHSAGPVHGERTGDPLQLRARSAGHTLDLLRRPARNLVAHHVHAVDALADKILVFPAVLEDVPENAPDQRHVSARAETHILVGMGCRTREARITDDDLGAVLLLGLKNVQQCYRMRLGRV